MLHRVCGLNGMLAQMPFDDLESMGSGVSLPLQPSERLNELSILPKSFSYIDARDALKLCEMSCVGLRVRMEGFLRQRCAELVAVSYQSDATPGVTVETLVSLLQGRRVRQQKRQPCKYLLEPLFAVDTKDGPTVVFPFFAPHVSLIKRHGPTWLLHTRRSCIPSLSVADVQTCRICVLTAHCSQPMQIWASRIIKKITQRNGTITPEKINQVSWNETEYIKIPQNPYTDKVTDATVVTQEQFSQTLTTHKNSRTKRLSK